MVKHIVMWKLAPEAEGGAAADNAAMMKERLEALAGRIPGLLHIEVGVDVSRSPASADVVLYSEFTDAAALGRYQKDPGHLAVAGFIGTVSTARTVVDYEA